MNTQTAVLSTMLRLHVWIDPGPANPYDRSVIFTNLALFGAVPPTALAGFVAVPMIAQLKSEETTLTRLCVTVILVLLSPSCMLYKKQCLVKHTDT